MSVTVYNETKTEYYIVSAKMKQVKNSSNFVMVEEDSTSWISIDYQYNKYQWIPNQDLAFRFKSKISALSAARADVGPWYCMPKPETLRIVKITETRTLVSEEVDFD